MILKYFTILFLTFFTFSSLSRASEFPELKEGSTWQSIVITKMGELSFPGISKKWSINRSSDGRLYFKERTELSLGQDSSGKPILMSLSVPIQKTFSCEPFTNMPFPRTSELTRLSDGRFSLSFDAGFKFKVVLIPSRPKLEIKSPSHNIGVIEAPLDPSLVGALPVTYSNGFLHHTNKKRVLIDPSVPPRFLNAISSSLLNWNRAFSRNIYSEPVVATIKDEDCISTRTLCITWQGPQDSISWIGWGGITAISFDPEDGELIGGLIKLQNLINSEQLLQTPNDITEVYALKKYSSRFFASLMLRKEEFKTYAHPFESQLIKSLLMHEIGHANGLKHDFSASKDANGNLFSSSIMDYLPFPTVFLVDDLQTRDLARLSSVYQQTNYADYDGCSDEMEKSKEEINCVKGDLGDPVNWYADIVNQSKHGVFETVVEYISGLPERDYLSLFAKIFSGKLTTIYQQQKASAFLCHQKDRETILNKLRDTYETTISCP